MRLLNTIVCQVSDDKSRNNSALFPGAGAAQCVCRIRWQTARYRYLQPLHVRDLPGGMQLHQCNVYIYRADTQHRISVASSEARARTTESNSCDGEQGEGREADTSCESVGSGGGVMGGSRGGNGELLFATSRNNCNPSRSRTRHASLAYPFGRSKRHIAASAALPTSPRFLRD